MALRIALVGCGIISKAHRRGYEACGDRLQLVACCDHDQDKAAAVAAESGVSLVTTDYGSLLADPKIDAVDLCLPHHLHREFAVAGLEAGKHVLCEKPIATTLADADAMIAAAAQSERTFMVAESSRFRNGLDEARELLESGVIGEIIGVEGISAWFQGGHYLHTPWRFVKDQLGGGALIDGGIHGIDVLLALCGPVRRVGCFTRQIRDIFPAEDTAYLILEFASGVLGHLTVHWSSKHTPFLAARVSGSEGALTLGHDRIEVTSEKLEQQPTVYEPDRQETFARMLTHFVDCVETGRQPIMDGATARADLELVVAAYQAAATGTIVELPLSP